MIRAHYPLHPYTPEQADRLGILVWSEIPVYRSRRPYLAKRAVRERAADELRDEHRSPTATTRR